MASRSSSERSKLTDNACDQALGIDLIKPFRTAPAFWGTNYLELVCSFFSNKRINRRCSPLFYDVCLIPGVCFLVPVDVKIVLASEGGGVSAAVEGDHRGDVLHASDLQAADHQRGDGRPGSGWTAAVQCGSGAPSRSAPALRRCCLSFRAVCVTRLARRAAGKPMPYNYVVQQRSCGVQAPLDVCEVLWKTGRRCLLPPLPERKRALFLICSSTLCVDGVTACITDCRSVAVPGVVSFASIRRSVVRPAEACAFWCLLPPLPKPKRALLLICSRTLCVVGVTACTTDCRSVAVPGFITFASIRRSVVRPAETCAFFSLQHPVDWPVGSMPTMPSVMIRKIIDGYRRTLAPPFDLKWNTGRQGSRGGAVRHPEPAQVQ